MSQHCQSSGGSQVGRLADGRIRVDKKTGHEWIRPIPREKGNQGEWGIGPDKAERLRRIDQLNSLTKEAVRMEDRSADFRDKIGQLVPEVCSDRQAAQTCSACLLKKGQFHPDEGFSFQMWRREEKQRRFCRKCMKNLWCYACGKIHRPGAFTYTQQEFKLDKNRRCKECVDGGVAVKKWKTNSSGQDLLLEGGRPVEIKLEKIKIKKEEHAANKDCYYAVLQEDEQESDGSEPSDEHHDDSSGDEADSDDEVDSGSSESSSEENDLDFNRVFSSATLEPGPSQRELQRAKELARATNEKEEEKADSLRVRASWGLLQGESVRVLDYKVDQEAWAKSAQPDGSLTQVELQDGQFAVVAKDWGGDGQVKIAQHLTWGGDASGYQ